MPKWHFSISPEPIPTIAITGTMTAKTVSVASLSPPLPLFGGYGKGLDNRTAFS